MADFIIRGEVIADSRQVAQSFRNVREEVNQLGDRFKTASLQMSAQSDNLIDEMEGYLRVLRDTRREEELQNRERLQQLRAQTSAQQASTLALSQRKFERRTAGPLADLQREKLAVEALQRTYDELVRDQKAAGIANEKARKARIAGVKNLGAAINKLQGAEERLRNAEESGIKVSQRQYEKLTNDVFRYTQAVELARAETVRLSTAAGAASLNVGSAAGLVGIAGSELADGKARLAAAQAIADKTVAIESDALTKRNNLIKQAATNRIDNEIRANNVILEGFRKAKSAISDLLVDHRRWAEQARRSVFDVANAWTSFGSSVRNAAGIVRSAGYSMTIALTAPLLILGKMALHFNNVSDQAHTAFKTMLNGAGFVEDAGARANDMLERLFTLARTSPFEFENVVTSAQKLLLAGQTDTGGLIKLLTAIGDTAAASGGDAERMGEKIERLTGIFSKIGLQGRLRLIDLKQLSYFMNAQKFLLEAWREKMGDASITAIEFRKSVTKGLVDSGFAIEVLQKGMEKNFGGMADQLRNTFPGALAELKDTIAIFAADVFRPIQDVLTKMMRAISDRLEEWRKIWNTLSDETQERIAKIIIAVALIGPALIGISVVLSTLGGAITSIGGLLRGLASLFGPLITLAGGWTVALGAAVQFVTQNFPLVLVIIAAIALAWRLVMDNLDRLRYAWRAVTEAFTAWLSGPGKGLIEGFAAAWQKLKDIFSFVWERIVSVFQAAIDVITQFFLENWDTITGAISNITTVIYFILGVFKTVFIDDLGAIWTIVGGTVNQAFELIKTIVLTAFDVISGVIGIVLALINLDIPEALHILGRMVGRVVGNIFNYVIQLVESIWKTLQEWWASFAGFFKGIWQWIWSTSTESIMQIVDNILNWIATIPSRIYNTAVEAGQRFVSGFWEGFDSSSTEQRNDSINTLMSGFRWPEFTLPKFDRITGGENLADQVAGEGGTDATKKKADTVAGAIANLTEEVNKLRSALNLDEKNIEGFVDLFTKLDAAIGPEGFAAGVSDIIAKMKELNVETAKSDFRTAYERIKIDAQAEHIAFLVKYRNSEFLTKERIAEHERLTRDKVFYERLQLIKKAQIFEEKAFLDTEKIKNGIIDDGKSTRQKELEDIESQIAAFSIEAKASSADAQRLIDERANALYTADLAKKTKQFKEAQDEIRGIEIDGIRFTEVQKTAQLEQELAEYKRKTIDAFGDTEEARLLIKRKTDAELAKLHNAELDRIEELAKRQREIDVSLIQDPVKRRNAEMALKVQEAYNEEWLRTGSYIKAAIAALREFLNLKKIQDAETRTGIAEGLKQSNPFINVGLIADSLPDDLIEKMQRLGESVQSLGDKFGGVATNAYQLRYQIEAMDAFTAGDIFGGLKASLQSLGAGLLTNAQMWVSLGQAIGNALRGSAGEVQNWGMLLLSTVLSVFGQIAIQMGTAMITMGSILSATILFAAQGANMVTNGILMVALGVGLVAAGAALAPRGGTSAATGTASAATASGGAGGSQGRERRTPRREFPTSGEITVNVNFNSGKNDKIAKIMLGMLEKEGAITVDSLKGRHNRSVRRAVRT